MERSENGSEGAEGWTVGGEALECAFLEIACTTLVETKADADVRRLGEGFAGRDEVEGGGKEGDV